MWLHDWGMDYKNHFITTSQAARTLGLSPERVRQFAVCGELASIETPLGRLFARVDVERLAEKRRLHSQPRSVSAVQ